MKKIALLTFLITCCCWVHAQENPGFKIPLNHIALSVKDVNRLANFYKTVLLLAEITNRTKMDSIRWLMMPDGRKLHLVYILKENVSINKAVHIGLTTDSFYVV